MSTSTVRPAPADDASARARRVGAWARLLGQPSREPTWSKYAARLGGAVAIIAMISYLTWRATSTMPTGGVDRVFGWLLWIFEALPILPLTFRWVLLWSLDAKRPPRRGPDQKFGTAVVFVPTYNEPAAVLAPTVAAACRLAPTHETWVLDDGDREWVRDMCAHYGARYVQRDVHDHAKAGNINHALRLLDGENHSAEFIAILDCDHVPLDGFLYETLGWFDDPHVALVQAPQAYFNEQAFDGDGFAGEQGIFFHALMVARSNEKADPPWCGSTSVVRRTAITEVGGIAQETITEDLHTTLKLLRLGWRSVYHHQILAVGLAPDTPAQYLVQRRRWALGAMQVYVTEKLWRPKPWLTLRNHLEYLVSAFWWFEGALTAFVMLIPAAVLVFGVEAVRTDPRLYLLLVGIEVGLRMFGANLLYRGLIQFRHALELRVLRIPIGIASAWWLFTRRHLDFEVTPKGASDERLEGRVPPVITVLGIGLGIILTYGALTLFVPLPWRSSRAATLTGGVWLLWAETMLLLGIARVRNPEFLTSRRVAHRFAVPATVEVVGASGTAIAQLQDISTTGVGLSFDAPPPAGEVWVRLPGASAIPMSSAWVRGDAAAYGVAPDDYDGMRTLSAWIFSTPVNLGHGVPDGLPAAAVIGDDYEAPGPRADHPARRPDIQGLRALAVGLVVLAHLGIAGLGGGFIGVDVFFVISGFLITGLLMREIQVDRRVSLKDFYARRALRILPAATLVSAAILLATGLLETTIRVKEYASDAFWSAAFAQNIHLIRQATDYFADQTASPFQHFWSLSVEEQFYLVWPVTIAVLARALKPRAVLIVVAVLTALSLGASISLTHTNPLGAYFSTYTRAFELGIGALVAMFFALYPTKRLPLWFAWAGGLIGAVAIVAAALTLTSAGFPGWRALIPTVGAALLIIAGRTHVVGINWLFARQPFRWLGDISYSLYLWHFPVIVLGAPQLPAGWPAPVRNLVLIAISLVLADLTYRMVERPLLSRRKSRFRGMRPLIWWPVAAVTALAIAFGSFQVAQARQQDAAQHADEWYATHQSICPVGTLTAAGTPDLAAVRAELLCGHELASVGAPVPPTLSPSALENDSFKNGGFCLRPDGLTFYACPGTVKAGRQDLVVMGDSHMGQWMPALSKIAAQRNLNFVPLVRSGCPLWALPTYSGGLNGNSPGCGEYRTQEWQSLATLHPALVVVASITDIGVRDGLSPLGSEWRAGIASILPRLAGLHLPVVVLGDTPLRNDLATPSAAQCLAQPGNLLGSCELTLTSSVQAAGSWVQSQAAAVGLTYVETDQLICVEAQCPAVAGGLGVFNDESHVSLTWSRHVATALGQLLPSSPAGTP